MNLSFYNEISGLNYLFYQPDETEVQSNFTRKYGKLTSELCQLIENYNIVQYTLIDITNRLSICHLVWLLDNQNGFLADPQRVGNPKETEIDYEAVKDYYEHDFIMDLEEKYLDRNGSDDDKENKDVEKIGRAHV